ncbi:MAG: hypothetical protein PUP93_10125 [Rhizonema sp. NSF051]|nr:hypothetical protein [Rhizonema sp. NSF051]
MYEPVGTVEHYLSRENYRNLAYEWNNLRFASAWINSSKGTLDDQVLDRNIELVLGYCFCAKISSSTEKSTST